MDINIPSQVLNFANLAAFPVTGSVKTIYIANNTNIAYYWNGSAYQPISIQDLSGLVPYTGATQDADLGNNGLDAKFVKIKGTGGNGHLNMKHQSSNPTAGGSETVIFAGNDGEPRFKNDGNAVEQFASRQWVNGLGLQTTPIVVNANITAQNDRVYHVVANATFTDPTPVEGRGYVVIIRNGSATIGGVPYPFTRIIYRLYASGGWQNFEYRDAISNANTFVPNTRTINGLDLTVNRTLTTANINDSTNRRYVTDAQLSIIGNTSGINTGDQDLSGLVPNTRTVNGKALSSNITLTPSDIGTPSGSGTFDANGILSKLGWFRYNRISDSSPTVGITETIVDSVLIPTGTYTSGGIIRISDAIIKKTGINGQCEIKMYIGPNSNNLSGATQIATFNNSTLSGQTIPFSRQPFSISNGFLLGFPFSVNSQLGNTSTGALLSSLPYNDNIANYAIITIKLTNASDIAVLSTLIVQNF